MLKDRIREARLRKGMSQKQVADILGVAVSTYSGYETGKSEPDINKICVFMDALGVDANYLWQDYNQEETKKSPAHEGTGDGVVSLERATAALVAMGYIREGEQLSDDDLAFLTHVMGLLDAWFSREEQ
jgi:transcriptional regulator with XRE-family HTH domain